MAQPSSSNPTTPLAPEPPELLLELFPPPLATTTIVTPSETVPPVPKQVNVNVLVCVSGPMFCEPDNPFVPDQAPAAVHWLAFVEVQSRIVLWPDVTVVACAAINAVGDAAGGGMPTVMVTES